MLLAGCGAREQNYDLGGKKGLKVVATTGFAAEIADRLLAGQAEVTQLMGPGVDPHLYKPALRDMEQLYNADIVVASGLHLEGKMADVLEKLARTKRVIFLGKGLGPKDVRYATEFGGLPDPHFWFDISLFAKAAGYCAEQLANEKRLDGKAIGQNATRYRKELELLEKEVFEQLGKLEGQQRVLITAHDAFGYFGRRYGYRLFSLQGISTSSDFGLKDVTNLVDSIVQRKVPTIFPESSTPAEPLAAIQDGCKAKGQPLAIGQPLYADAMGQKGTAEGTYIGMFRYNFKEINNLKRTEAR